MSNKVPILFIVFNRPHKTALVWEKIAEYRPEVIYLAADGARKHVSEDIERCTAVRSFLDQNITWPCIVHRLYAEDNAGCRIAVSRAINWFFSEEEYGIVLEDDCVPDASFFEYAASMLRHYKHDPRVHSISGCNFGFKSKQCNSLLFSRYMNMWGWATWRRVARNIDYDLEEWGSFSIWRKYLFLFRTLVASRGDLDPKWLMIWKNKFDMIVGKNYDTWDYQWFYQQFKSGALTLYPGVNLIRNIGYDDDATHTKSKQGELYMLGSIETGLKVPEEYRVDPFFEDAYVKEKWVTYSREPLARQFAQIILYTPLKQLYKRFYFILHVKRSTMKFSEFNRMGIREYKRLRLTSNSFQ